MTITEIATQHLRQFLNQTSQTDLPSLEGPVEHLRLAIELLFPEAAPPRPLHAPQVFDQQRTQEAHQQVSEVLQVLDSDPTEEQLGTAQTVLLGVYQHLLGLSQV